MNKDKKQLKEVVKSIHEKKQGEILLVNNWDFDRKTGELLLYYDDLLVDHIVVAELIECVTPDTYEFTDDFMKNDNIQ
jgi:predicted GTPase